MGRYHFHCFYVDRIPKTILILFFHIDIDTQRRQEFTGKSRDFLNDHNTLMLIVA